MGNETRSRLIAALGCILLAAALVSPALGQNVFINEIHYDNIGGDVGEAVEIAGPAGTDLSGWSLVLYNGSGGLSYNITALGGTIPNQQAGFGTVAFNYPTNGLQNGSPDGIALVDGSSTVVQFLSYEGSFTANDGPASGLTSTDIGVAEGSSTPVGHSLQLGGTGSVYTDFSWQSELPNTFDAVNTSQTFDDGGGGDTAPSVVSTTPGDGAGGVAVDTDVTIDFSEGVLAAGSWFDIDCTSSGNHSAAASGGPTSFVLNPDVDFVSSESCTVTVFAAQVTDLDADDPPDNMAADYVFSFATVADVELVINEIDYDQPGTDAGEFIEIRNNDSVSVDLDPFSLELVNGNGGSIYNTIDLPAVTLAPGDYFVVCGDASQVLGCDLDVSPNTNLIQNGSPDAVALTLGGSIVDTVSYEGSVPSYVEGSGSGLEDSSSGADANKSISRIPDGADTDQNNVDFQFVCATPGAANTTNASDCPSVAPPNLVINEIDYDQPGSDAAEFVEILNSGNGGADLSGVSLLLVNGNGGGAAIYNTIALPSITLGAGDYFVVCGDALNVANCDLDVSPNTNLIQNGSPDAVALVLGGLVLDTVSYEGDTGAPYTEGTGTSAADSNDAADGFKGLSRTPNGSDTNDNNADFSFVCITPGGANTSLAAGCTPLAPVLEIYEIQGAGAASPFANQSIRTEENVVTAVGTDQFAMQTPTARTDGDIDTSDGIIVFTGGAPTVAVGDLVNVTGEVVEFFGFTEYTGGSTVEIAGPGAGAVPAPVIFDATVPSPHPTAPSCSIEYECYEGMLIEIADGRVTGPNQRFNTDPVAEVHITAAPARTFREPGVEFPGLAMPPIPTWDGNPEVFELDPDKLGLANQIIPAGSSFSAIGVLGFEFGGYEFWPASLTVTPAPLPVAVRAREPGEFTVGSLNLFRLFDDIDDPADPGDAVVSTVEYQRRLAKFCSYISDVLDTPDILAVQEVESLVVLQDLADRLETDLACAAGVHYTPYLIEGNDIGTIDVGFLVQDHILVDAVTQLGKDETFIDPTDMSVDILHDRPPLLLEGSCQLEFGAFPISVMVVHNRSFNGIDDSSSGPRVRFKRLSQAESIATKVQDLQNVDPDVRLVVIGDFNDFEFTDGYVDAIGVISGDFDPAMSFVCSEAICSPDLVEPNLDNQVLTLPVDERYSFIFRGSAQVLDHALTSTGLAGEISGVAYGRGNTDAAVDLINDDGSVEPANLPLRSSDHDGLVVYVVKDEDGDGVPNDNDVCAGTVIPESVPTVELKTNRWALIDGDGVFDTNSPNGNGPGFSFDLGDTAGCSCEQIIAAQGLGNGHTKHGCSNDAMLNWVELVASTD